MVSGFLLLLIMIALWGWALGWATSELHQGDVYRIIYVHVPSALSSFVCAFVLFVASLLQLRKKQKNDEKWFHVAKASAEVGLLFTFITLCTGSIWGKPTWGTWWTWDARLTTTFILALLFVSYLLLCQALQQSPVRHKASAVLGVLIFTDVPIIYKSVVWWRTLHQPPSLMATGGSTMDKEILFLLISCLLFTISLALWLIWQRVTNLKLLQQLEVAYYQRILQERR
jgi:heme exporter protein C